MFWIEGKLIGRVRMNKASRLSFDYEPRWRDSPGGYSLSGQHAARQHQPIRTTWLSPYLWNLLPENPNILQRWGQQFSMSPRRIRSSF